MMIDVYVPPQTQEEKEEMYHRDSIINTIPHLLEYEKKVIPLFINESGSRTYGFLNEHSDIDARGVYLIETNELLGLNTPNNTMVGMGNDLKPPLDWQFFEVKKFINLILKSNLNTLEWILNPPIYINPQFKLETNELRKLACSCITKQLGSHARGWSYSIYKMNWDDPKKVLYALRPLMLYLTLIRDKTFCSDINELGRRMEINTLISELIFLRKRGLPTPKILKDKANYIYGNLSELSKTEEKECWIPNKIDNRIYEEMNEQLLWLRQKPYT